MKLLNGLSCTKIDTFFVRGPTSMTSLAGINGLFSGLITCSALRSRKRVTGEFTAVRSLQRVKSGRAWTMASKS